MTRFHQRLSNFQKVFQVFQRRLVAFQQNPEDEGYQMALIQAFEIIQELSWKTMKDYLEQEGYADIASPRSVLRTAFVSGLILKADEWMDSLRIRNLTSHAYLEEVMNEVVKFISHSFPVLLKDLKQSFEEK